ncbi:conserved protein, unknown function [Plasmodium chabaudi chabaudi]|uniref:DUF4460 domain-containing protein n=2 Tax=Plasmodium chabaudi TaxID=5825 RepID=A0A077TIM8_PLACU|nr:conserved protein, unknown function [Plasmodium chabaudi chabaudi]SCM19692.1 conserved protein, unknown function [Plasmodium chabaudi chabaudi]SCN58953.1 conserved protein, unknown function [Plasmodium chabaudi adami]VTZ67686.1 conserved protein, unknown function [Plasmodium chabaudi chabaudi]|eukprot:XP_016653420.1 conserved Plasmodium protein, unknown function [Plasmodium chabaudi chabaudi]
MVRNPHSIILNYSIFFVMFAKFMFYLKPSNKFVPNQKCLFQYINKQNYESNIFKKSVRRMLLFFYKEVHPDLTQDLPDELKKINSESLSILNSYIDILSSPDKNENNIFVEKKLIFFKLFENSEHKIIKGRYKNIELNLQTINNNMSEEDKENIVAKLIYDIKKSLEKIQSKNIFNNNDNMEDFENIIDDTSSYFHHIKTKNEKDGTIKSIWDDLMDHVKNKEALYHPSEEEIKLVQEKKSYFYYIKKKLECKYQKINHRKRRKEKLQNINKVANKIVQDKFADIEKKKNNIKTNDDQIFLNQSYKITQMGYDPNLIFFNKDINDDKKKKAIENICGINLNDDADKWLLENCLKLLKNHKIQIPIVFYTGKEISLSQTFGYIYLPVDFCLNQFFTFLENNLHEARTIRGKVLKCFDM